jgi:hypothetical protein
MARKKLTPGANAARVEERIARTPGDLNGPSIFQLLKKETADAPQAQAPAEPAARPRTPARQEPATGPEPPVRPRTPPKRRAGRAPIKAAPEEPPRQPKPVPRPAGKSAQKPAAPAQAPSEEEPRLVRGRAAISLTSDERVVLVKACQTYRNGLPTYLRSVQREVALLDGIIGRLSGRRSGQGKSTGP